MTKEMFMAQGMTEEQADEALITQASNKEAIRGENAQNMANFYVEERQYNKSLVDDVVTETMYNKDQADIAATPYDGAAFNPYEGMNANNASKGYTQKSFDEQESQGYADLGRERKFGADAPIYQGPVGSFGGWDDGMIADQMEQNRVDGVEHKQNEKVRFENLNQESYLNLNLHHL